MRNVKLQENSQNYVKMQKKKHKISENVAKFAKLRKIEVTIAILHKSKNISKL